MKNFLKLIILVVSLFSFNKNVFSCDALNVSIGEDVSKASEVLDFRDKAFDTYFNNTNYLNMIKKKFDENTMNHILKMSAHKLKRKHQFEEVVY